jgi:metal-dependent hydrolase (beta-lactamase superfamily II)
MGYLLRIVALVVFAVAAYSLPAAAQEMPARVTVLYDAFGRDSSLQKDWGYAALVEVNGKRILFDTGNNADVLARNAKVRNADLSQLDFVVMSHRHGDHMGGMSYLLGVNPRVKIYAPKGGLRRLWRRPAERVLSQGRLAAARAALFRRQSAYGDALRQRLAAG